MNDLTVPLLLPSASIRPFIEDRSGSIIERVWLVQTIYINLAATDRRRSCATNPKVV